MRLNNRYEIVKHCPGTMLIPKDNIITLDRRGILTRDILPLHTIETSDENAYIPREPSTWMLQLVDVKFGIKELDNEIK